jgi:DNA-binding SARP family transcriptional activator
VSGLERSIVAAADVPLVRWVGQELAILGELIAGRRHPAVPVAVEFSEGTGIEILWDQPILDAPAPWEAMPGGWSWRTTYDAEAPVPVAERPSPIPGLVTVGRREGRQLMVNLEALGTVSVAGDPNAAEGLIRSIVVELATCDEIADAAVAVTDDVPIKLGDGDVGIDVLTPVQVADVLAEAGRSAADAVEGLETGSTFGYRTYSTPVLPLPVTVVAADPSHPAIGDAAETVARNCGASLVLLGRSSAADAQIDVMSDGTATIHPLGLTFEAALLPPSTEVDIGALLADAPEHDIKGDPDEVRRPETTVPGSTRDVGELPLRPWWLKGSDLDLSADEVTAGSTGVAEEQPGEDAAEWSIDLRAGSATTAAPLAGRSLPPKMLVKVLGAPRIVDGPNLGRRELNVVVFIACSHRPVSHEHIQDAIWGGGAISTKSVFNLIGSARTALGRWDEKPVLSTAKRPHNTIELHPEVRTDVDLLRDLVAAAEAAPSNDALALLLEALELVEGPPFDAAGYDWALTSQLVSEAEHLIERASSMAAEIAIEQGDLARARWAVTVGLRAIPGDEALYRIRMRVEDAAANPAAVRRAYDELAAHLEEYGEEPSLETRQLLDRARADGRA